MDGENAKRLLGELVSEGSPAASAVKSMPRRRASAPCGATQQSQLRPAPPPSDPARRPFEEDAPGAPPSTQGRLPCRTSPGRPREATREGRGDRVPCIGPDSRTYATAFPRDRREDQYRVRPACNQSLLNFGSVEFQNMIAFEQAGGSPPHMALVDLSSAQLLRMVDARRTVQAVPFITPSARTLTVDWAAFQ